jgi:uncharacterized repeat protein (TIGR01451 family)
VTQNIAAGAYIVMPENGGIGVFAHEYAHNLGAIDLYAYNEGETSTGFWALQADDWTGYPIGFEPPAPDPMHLDWWGWLNPMVITDASKTYEFTLGQASRFSTIPGNAGMYRGAKIELPDGNAPLAVPPWQGSHYWWGGKQDEANASMTTKTAISMTGGTTATLSFDLVYDIEEAWDFLWVQVSTDNGATWKTLSNTHTSCTHVAEWIGDLYGMDGQCGFTGYNHDWPAPEAQTFDLTPYLGKNMLLKLWFMTDWGTTYTGAFVDNVVVTVGGATKFSDNAESGSGNWNYVAPWRLSDGTQSFDHNFYLQWRNVSATGGYDSALGDSRWRYGPANTGLLVWYNDEFYSDNEVFSYLTDFPGWGPKGRMLVVDSHPDPYREPSMVAAGYNNEGGNVAHRSLMRDAPFSLLPTVDFTMTNSYPFTTTTFTSKFTGQPAVSEFHDALGYYPGAEYASRGPGYVPASMKWVTKQWDASTVVPSKAFYGIKAPGYVGTGAGQQEFRFDCASTNTGRLGCYWYGANTGLGYNGGTGDPREVNGQYGWNVKILSQTDMTATVKVWNLAVGKTVGPTPPPITAPGTYWFTYTVALNNMGSVAAPVNVTITLPAGLNFVSGSPSGSALLPPGGTANVDRQIVWGSYSLAGNTTVTFTVMATATVAAGDPFTTWKAYADVDDGINPPTRDMWSTTASLYTAPGGRPAAGYSSSKSGKPGDTVLHRVAFTNTSPYNSDTFTVTATTTPGSWPDYLLPAGAGMLEASAVPVVVGAVAPGATAEVFVLVTIPSTVSPGAKATTTVTTISVGDPTKTGSMALTTMTPYLLYLPVVMR